ncbi:circadian clock protein kinase KaiC [Pseudomonas antarctica]|uniref:Circadian clock protein kinase KaiC n=1 Tax=Pseudomonas antarctica TaxID=219572 RepID=A0ABQ6ZQP2_9PSED|nr:circadian clock protein kinase KaiC [Pseudomonas antarctica]
MSTNVHIKRLSTGVPGFNEVLGGGLPEFSFNLIAGPPGSGKTTLAHQMMFAVATAERPALYFTVLGEPPLKIMTDAIIVQRYIELDRRLLRVMAVVKVRASAHSDKLRLYEISDEGMVVGRPLKRHEGLLGGRPSLRSLPE